MKVFAELVGNRIYVRSPFAYKDRLKAIPGARWSKTSRSWTFPLDLETGRMMRDEFGEELELGPELTAWGAQQVAREKDLLALVDVKDIDVMAEVDVPLIRERCPTMWAAMMARPYQPVAAQYMARARHCLNGDQPGVGKTIETLGALIAGEVTGPILVLAPRTSCKVVWPHEIRKWYAGDVDYTITNVAGMSPAQREKAWAEFTDNCTRDGMHFLIANAEQVGIKRDTECPDDICNGDEDWCPSFDKHKNRSTVRRPFLHSIEWSAIIADETHKWLINTRGKKASQVGYGFTRLRTKDDGPRYALSGTPLKGLKHNLFGTINWLRPKVYTSKWRWIQSYFIVTKEEKDIGRRGTVTTLNIGKMNPDREEAFFRSLQSIMIRRTKDELRAINPAWMPPEKRYHDVWVEMDPKQRTRYNAMSKSGEVEMKSGTLTATGVLALITRLRQFSNSDGDLVDGTYMPTLPSAKFDWLVQFLDERGIEPQYVLSDEVHKVVVASQFTQQIKAWAAELEVKGIKSYVLTGETTDKNREKFARAFQTQDDVRVFFINTTAGGVSITLDAADDIVIMDESWVPDDQEQVEDRVHRASNVEHQVDVWYVRSKGTIEEDLAATNGTKAQSNYEVLDARRGLRFAAERFGAKFKEDF